MTQSPSTRYAQSGEITFNTVGKSAGQLYNAGIVISNGRTAVLVDFIMRQSGFMVSYEYLLITKHMSVWGRVFAENIEWPLVWRGYAVVFGVNITLFTLGFTVFESRDLKS